jgi:2-dehydropantoate 2-reductase
MKIAVIGAGAMGGALAAESALAGHEVHIVDPFAELVEKIRRDGLTVRRGPETLVARPAATVEPAEVDGADLCVVFVKAQHTRAAAASVATIRREGTAVLSLQNGWGNAEVLADELGSDGLLYGVTYNSCSVAGLGEVNHTGVGDTFIGAYGDDRGAAAGVAEALTGSGWTTIVSPDVRTEIWKKLILNAATLPTSGLTGLVAGELGRSEAMAPLVERVAREAAAVALGMGLAIDPDERVSAIFATLERAGSGKASMLQDIEARRKTEIEVINRAVVRAGAEVGVPTPLNEALSELVSGLESGWQR